MLARDAYANLLEWKRTAHGKALLVDGARQVGKTYLVEEFARREYPHMVKIDFLRDDSASTLLSHAHNADEAIEAIGLLRERKLVPGRTLVFLDEVQEAPKIAGKACCNNKTLQ